MRGAYESPEGVRIRGRLLKEMPWGPLFATRRNFECGYCAVEQYFVDKYLKRASSILIIGSGNGPEARPIAADGHRIVCFDIGFLYVKSGSLLCAWEGLGNIHFLQADMHALPFAKETFDFVFFTIYATAGGRRFDVLRQVRETLRPGGMMLLMTPTPLYPSRFPLPTPDTVLLTEEEMVEEIMNIEGCGFRFHESSVDSRRTEYRFAVFEGR